MTEQVATAEKIGRSRDSLARASIDIARAISDLDDLRRQVEASRRQLEEEKRSATQEYYRLAGRVLEILEDLDSEEIRNASPEEVNEYLRSRMEDAIVREGISRIPAPEGVFDPVAHDIIETVTDNTRPDGTIVRVARAGYVRGPVILVRPGVVITHREADRL